MIARTATLLAATALAIALALAAPGRADAQGVRLTSAQQQMLNSLPPAQRQQALDAIRSVQAQQDAGAGQQSINEAEPDDFLEPESDETDESLEDEIPKAAPRTRLVVTLSPLEALTPEEVIELNEDPVLSRLVGSHLHVLDDDGVLTIPGLDAVPLAGLSEEDIESRLGAESALSVFAIEARILGQEPIGVEALQPFGHEIFEIEAPGLAPPSSGPVPPDYVLGPGDMVRVQLFGNVDGIYELEVSRDGTLNLPELGPVTVAGIPFSEFRADIDKRVKEMLIGTQVSVTMGPLRSIRVFVLGDVNRPGSYVVGGLSTISSALYEAGGISKVGSFRNIQLKRDGKVVTTLDLYDLLIEGDNSGDRRLQPNDVILVAPVGDTIAIAGAVKRPAIYETRGATSIASAVKLAGGLTPEAFGEGSRLERIDDDRVRTVLAVNLSDPDSASRRVKAGDTLVVPEVLPDFDNAVLLSGHLHRPGPYSWRPGMRITDLVGSVEELKDGADMNYVLIRREPARGKPIEVVSADLEAALLARGSVNDVPLLARDQVFVFSMELGRARVVEPIIEDLRLQATHDAPTRQVQVSGHIRVPGVYPLENDMRISDLVRAGGGLSEEAYALEAELTRYTVTGGSMRVVDVYPVDLAGVLLGEAAADVALAPYDFLSINRIPKWDSDWTVSIDGEVRFPGEYRVKRGESLNEVLRRAGGLTDDAFPEGAVFLRESLKEREQEQIEFLARRLESDLTTLSLQLAESGGSDTLSTGRALLDQLRRTEAVGRLVIDPRHLDIESLSSDVRIELRDGDQLLVPKRSQVVTVIGETQQNTSHLYLPELDRDDYINLSGGLTRRADKGRIYIVRANGAVVVRGQSRWLGRGGNVDIRPGDTIVVPLDTDRIRPLTFWTNVTQILYQGAIAIAAIDTFGK